MACVPHQQGQFGGETGARRRSLRSRSEGPFSYPRRVCLGAPQSAGTAGGAGRLDTCEPPLLRTYGYPLTGKSFSTGCGTVISGYDYRCRRDQPRWQPGSQGLTLFAWRHCACRTLGASRRRWGSGSGRGGAAPALAKLLGFPPAFLRQEAAVLPALGGLVSLPVVLLAALALGLLCGLSLCS